MYAVANIFNNLKGKKSSDINAASLRVGVATQDTIKDDVLNLFKAYFGNDFSLESYLVAQSELITGKENVAKDILRKLAVCDNSEGATNLLVTIATEMQKSIAQQSYLGSSYSTSQFALVLKVIGEKMVELSLTYSDFTARMNDAKANLGTNIGALQDSLKTKKSEKDIKKAVISYQRQMLNPAVVTSEQVYAGMKVVIKNKEAELTEKTKVCEHFDQFEMLAQRKKHERTPSTLT
jgi:hypothetical protein